MNEAPVSETYRIYFESIRYSLQPVVIAPYARKFIIGGIERGVGHFGILDVVDRGDICEYLTKRHEDVQMEYRRAKEAEEARREAFRAQPRTSQKRLDPALSAAIADLDLSDLEF